jgi:hypothetical protein
MYIKYTQGLSTRPKPSSFITTLYGMNKKHDPQQYLHCWLHTRCRWNVVTEPLASNKHLLCLHYSGFQAPCHNGNTWLGYELKCAVEQGSVCKSLRKLHRISFLFLIFKIYFHISTKECRRLGYIRTIRVNRAIIWAKNSVV